MSGGLFPVYLCSLFYIASSLLNTQMGMQFSIEHHQLATVAMAQKKHKESYLYTALYYQFLGIAGS